MDQRRILMDHNNIRSENNKNICNGLGCFSKATHSIEEEDGETGMIALELCDECIIKFYER